MQDFTQDAAAPAPLNAVFRLPRFKLSTLAASTALVAVYLITRLRNLLILPVFADEGTHILFAHGALDGNVLSGMWAGKWLTIQIMARFVALPFDDLLMARLVSVLIGIAIIACIIKLGSLLHSLRAGFIGGALYVIFPYALFYDRLALADTYQTLTGCIIAIISIYFVRSQARKQRMYALLLLAAVPGAILIKLTGLVFMAIPLAAVIAFSPWREWRRRIVLILPSIAASLVVLAVLIWRGMTSELTEKGTIQTPIIDLIQTNIGLFSSWFWTLLTPPLFILGAASILFLLIRWRSRSVWFLLMLVVIDIIPFIIHAEVWFPRYVHFALVPIALLIALCAVQVLQNWPARMEKLRLPGLIFTTALLVIWPLNFFASFTSHPELTPLPDVLESQYITEGPSGYGVREVAQYLEQLAEREPINVLRYNYWGPPYTGLDLYVKPSDRIALYVLGDLPESLARLAELAAERPSYFIVNSGTSGGDRNFVSWASAVVEPRLVFHFSRPGDLTGMEVWALDPTGTGTE